MYNTIWKKIITLHNYCGDAFSIQQQLILYAILHSYIIHIRLLTACLKLYACLMFFLPVRIISLASHGS